MSEEKASQERRRFPRVNGVVHFRRPRTMAPESLVGDISVGGMRVHWNDPVHTDEVLELEIFLAEGNSVICPGRVVWVRQLPLASPTHYEAGIEFLQLSDPAIERIRGVLEEDSPTCSPTPRGLRKFGHGPQVKVPHSTPGDLLRSVGLSRLANLFRSS